MEHGSPNLNEGKHWSEMDLFDLKNSLAIGTGGRVREKIAELEASPGAQDDGSPDKR
jgi:hypothetical protein